MWCPALDLAGCWVELGLNVETKISGELPPVDIMLSWEVSGGPMSWIRLSHLGVSGPTPG